MDPTIENFELIKNGMYYCKSCDFSCSKKSNFDAHLSTKKHAKKAAMYCPDAVKQDNTHKCENCLKTFKSKSGLWKHRKTCVEPLVTAVEPNNNPTVDVSHNALMNVVMQNNELLEQNAELHRTLKDQQTIFNESIRKNEEQLKTFTQVNNSVTNVDNRTYTNNHVNLNFFLHTQCKDAIPIHHFIQNIQLGVSDMKYIDSAGFVDGMMNVLNHSLRSIDLYKRPMHCTDIKSETLYFKQGDKWKKDTEEKTQLKKLIKAVEDKNYTNIENWKKEHPDALECDTPDNLLYIRMMTETLGGSGTEDEQARASKVAKQLMKEIYIGK